MKPKPKKKLHIKTWYQRFRAWQLNPFDYTNRSTHTEHCANCGIEFNDNFCPRCGQKAGVGPIGWNTVRQGLVIIWGMDSRSLGYSLLQMMFRPGYFISDYISGKRQVSFPPVKMLLLVAIGTMVIDYFFNSSGADNNETIELTQDAFGIFNNWADNNPGWAILSVASMMILPTWLYFRYAPKHYKHTLPEGFFIQVFMSTLIMMILALCTFVNNLGATMLIPVCYLIIYRQLFGFGWWGTLWRTCLSIFQGLIIIVFLSSAVNIIIGVPNIKPQTLIVVGVLTLLLILPGIFIGRKK